MRNVCLVVLAAVLSPLMLVLGLALVLYASVDAMVVGHASADRYWSWP